MPGWYDLDRLFDLFRQPGMLDSRAAWAAGGFAVLDRTNEKKVMVASHSLAPGLLFKKYGFAISRDDERENFAARAEGADCLRSFVREHDLRHVVVPQKQVVDLPPAVSSSSQILVVERVDIVSVEESEDMYARIDPAILSELCLVLFHFRGLDSIVDNVPFTSDGKLAFIDTENWNRGRRRRYLKYLRRYLSKSRRVQAQELFRQLEDSNSRRLLDEAPNAGDPFDRTSFSSSSWSCSSS